MRRTTRSIVRTAALPGALAALALACSGCAAGAPRFSQPQGGTTGAAAYAFAPGDEAFVDELGVRRRRRTGQIPWAFPGSWPVPQGWSLPQAFPLPLPGPLPSPGKGRIPAPSAGAPAAVAYARSKLGLPYCWGGTGPGCYDCSGLTSQSWRAGGKVIPRTSEGQAEQLPEVPLEQALPGDILWRPGHVALYIGDGQVIQAPRTGDVIKVSPAVRFSKAVRP